MPRPVKINNFIFIAKLIIACIAMAVFIYYFNPSLNQWSGWQTWQRITRLSILISVAIIIYLGSLMLLGLRTRDLKAPTD